MNLAFFDLAVLSLRAKICHSWLDHEIAMTSDQLVLDRWRAGAWPAVYRRWVTLQTLAMSLADQFGDFGASHLIDKLPVFQQWSAAERESLKHSIRQSDAYEAGVTALRDEYLAKLLTLVEASEQFFSCARGQDGSPDTMLRAWLPVRTCGRELRDMFTTERIPVGIVLP